MSNNTTISYDDWLLLCRVDWHRSLKSMISTLEQENNGTNEENTLKIEFYRDVLRKFDVSEDDRKKANSVIQNELRKPGSSSGYHITETPEKWNLLKNTELYKWQEEAKDTFIGSNRKGVIQAVTGTGKTKLALSIIQELQNREPDLRVVIVTPKVVIMDQWYNELINPDNTNLSSLQVGKYFQEVKDNFSDNKRIIVSVINSLYKISNKKGAIKEFLGDTDDGPLLLIADECHRYGSDKFRQIFYMELKWDYILGLSATPEREGFINIEEDDDTEIDYIDNITKELIGDTIYELSFKDVLEQGLLPNFYVNHHGIPLENTHQYDNLTNQLTDIKKNFENRTTGKNFLIDIRKHAINNRSPLQAEAIKYLTLTLKRRFFLYQQESRFRFTLELIEKGLDHYGDSFRCIIFHESLFESMLLWQTLVNNGFKAVAHNSKLPQSRDFALELFKNNEADIMCSAKTLIEGVNIPDATMGIIVASSNSPRQRIQTIGRLLRKDKSSLDNTIDVIYYSNTIEENIYKYFDWENFMYENTNVYYRYSMDNEQFVQHSMDGPPKNYITTEDEITEELIPGQEIEIDVHGPQYRTDCTHIEKKVKNRWYLESEFGLLNINRIDNELLNTLFLKRDDTEKLHIYGHITPKKAFFIARNHETGKQYYLGRVIKNDEPTRIGDFYFISNNKRDELKLKIHKGLKLIFKNDHKIFKLLSKYPPNRYFHYLDLDGYISIKDKKTGDISSILDIKEADLTDKQFSCLEKFISRRG